MADNTLEAAIAAVMKWYYQPLLAEKPEIVPHLPEPDTAIFTPSTTKILISNHFLGELESVGIPRDAATRGLLVHEIGHYSTSPQEAATQLFLSQIAHDNFKDWKANEILQYYMDVEDDIDSFRSSNRKHDLAQLCIGEYRMLQRKGPEASKMDIFMKAWSQKVSGIDMEVVADNVIKEKLKGMECIDFCSKDEYAKAASLLMFGKLIEDLIQEPRGTGRGDVKIANYSDKQINEALNQIIIKYGKGRYEMIKEHVKELLKGRFKDSFGKPVRIAGLESSTIKFNDDQVPYYVRKAAAHGVYIVKKPVKADSRELYPARNVTFETGDPISKLNPWSSPFILPGITKRWEEAMGRRVVEQYRTPDLGIWLDTSGSMTHPVHMSHAVLAAFVLGQNYHRNGAQLFLANFSTDVLFVGPTRDIDLFYSGACAYWGGGTVLNIERLRKYFESRIGHTNKMVATDAKDYEKLIENLSAHERAMFEEKSIAPTLDKKVIELYERTDNVLITDGCINNIKELVNYMNSIAKYSRNTILLLGNKTDYEAWSKLNLLNTQIILVEKPEDLLGLAIGMSSALTEAA